MLNANESGSTLNNLCKLNLNLAKLNLVLEVKEKKIIKMNCVSICSYETFIMVSNAEISL